MEVDSLQQPLFQVSSACFFPSFFFNSLKKLAGESVVLLRRHFGSDLREPPMSFFVTFSISIAFYRDIKVALSQVCPGRII